MCVYPFPAGPQLFPFYWHLQELPLLRSGQRRGETAAGVATGPLQHRGVAAAAKGRASGPRCPHIGASWSGVAAACRGATCWTHEACAFVTAQPPVVAGNVRSAPPCPWTHILCHMSLSTSSHDCEPAAAFRISVWCLVLHSLSRTTFIEVF